MGMALFSFGNCVSAATFNIAAGDVAGLKSAINSANTNTLDDTINLGGGTYSLTAQDNDSDGANGLPVILTDGGHSLTINGNGSIIENDSSSGSRFLQLGVGDVVTISNVTFVNGTEGFGGAIYKNSNSNLTLQNCTFTGNNIIVSGTTGPAGGAICNDSGMLTVQGCTFTGNFTESIMGPATAIGGGAIYNGGQATAQVTNCVFNANLARGNTNGRTEGGAIYNDGGLTRDGVMTITGCTFTGNTSVANGGAIVNVGQMTVNQCLFKKNSVADYVTASGEGGAIFNAIGTLTVENSTFYDNEAKDSNGAGGAIESQAFNTRNASLTVLSCTFDFNVSLNGSSIDIQSGSSAGALTELANNIFANGSTGNQNLHGVCLTARGPAASINSEGYNLSDDNGGGFLTTGVDQINTNPQFDTAGLQNHGGPTLTIALLGNSPAIDKGKSLGLTTDQRGDPRPIDFPAYPNAAGGDGSDIGAYEGSDSLQAGANLVVTTLSDHDDGDCGSDCSLREAINRSNGTVGTPAEGVHTITFTGAVTGTLTLSSELDISSDVNIQGPGARTLAVSGNSVGRVFAFTSGGSSISGLTIENGRVVATAGQTAQGGGIYTSVELVLTDCAFTGNQVVGGNGFGTGASGGKGQGGAIYSGSGLTLIGCTFTQDMATGGNGTGGFGLQRGGNGGAGQGGAVFNAIGLASLTNCSFFANTARGGNGGNGHSGGDGGAGNGGGVGNAATLIMTACTLESNFGGNSSGGTGSAGNGSAGVASGGITNISGGTATVTDTISWNNVANGGGGVDVDGAFTSGGYNLLGTGDHSTGFTATGDMKGTDASPLNAGVIGPPSNTGGPTDTFTLTSTSPAINASSQAVAPHRDQRGYLRTGSPDIGAFEFNGSLLNLISVAKNSNGLIVGVEVVQGKVYRLERKLNMTDAQWQTISDITDLTATGNDTEFLTDFDAVSGFNHAFYHVIFVR